MAAFETFETFGNFCELLGSSTLNFVIVFPVPRHRGGQPTVKFYVEKGTVYIYQRVLRTTFFHAVCSRYYYTKP